ncbi:hypothetical protein [Thalassospira alkalitolerans]|uniref:hypothetical protein n=1 Tax=Thalassospira alkalitolerans TaxID=1293890 RepID=UPI003AA881E5
MLLISYCFPPVSSPESFVTAKIMGALDGVDVDVLSADASNFFGRSDPSLDSYVNSRFARIERVSAGRIGKYLLSMRHLPLRPDRFMILNHRLHSKATEMLSQSAYDVLFTRSQYHSSHLVGLKLKKEFPHLPWVASFSDPWIGNKYEKRVPVLSSISEYFSKRVVAKADRLVFPTKGIMDVFSRQNSGVDVAGKGFVVPHGFDSELYRDVDHVGSGPLKLAYFGNFYGKRRVNPVFSALRELKKRQAISSEDVVFYIYTSSPRIVEQALLAYPDIKDVVKLEPAISHTRALNKMQEADVLLHVDADMEHESIFLPSKLIDYIGAQRPILTISPKGIAADITCEVGGVCVDISSLDGIVDALVHFIQMKNDLRVRSIKTEEGGDRVIDRYAIARLRSDVKEIIAGVV